MSDQVDSEQADGGQSDGEPFQINQERFQHDPTYRKDIVEKAVEQMMEEAERQNYEVTFEDLKPTVEIIDQISEHVQRKIELDVEERITKKRIKNGQLYGGSPSAPEQAGRVVSASPS